MYYNSVWLLFVGHSLRLQSLGFHLLHWIMEHLYTQIKFNFSKLFECSCPTVQCFTTLLQSLLFSNKKLNGKFHNRYLIHKWTNAFPGSFLNQYLRFLFIALFTFWCHASWIFNDQTIEQPLRGFKEDVLRGMWPPSWDYHDIRIRLQQRLRSTGKVTERHRSHRHRNGRP